MAKILLLSESHLGDDQDAFSIATTGLVENLLQQRHDIVVLCSPPPQGHPSEDSPVHTQLQVLSGVKNWNWLEFPRVVSQIIYHKPDIIHLIQPHGPALKRRLSLLDLVAQPSPIFSNIPLALSVMDLGLSQAHPQSLRPLIHLCDQIIVNDEEAQNQVCRQFVINANKVSISRPVPSRQFFSTPLSAPETEELPPYLYVPGDFVDHDEPLLLNLLVRLLEQESYTVIIGGGWGQLPWKRRRQWHERLLSQKIGAQVKITGHLPYPLHVAYMSGAQCTQLLTLKSSTLLTSLLEFMHNYLHGTTLNSNDFPLLKRNPVEGWVSLIRKSMSLPHHLSPPDHSLFDIAGNQIQRIYQRAQAHGGPGL